MRLKFGCFVTGTDTDVGKTLIAAALLHRCVERGWRSVGMKPVAAGALRTAEGGLRNADVDMLVSAGNVRASAEDINPYCFEEAIAPHLAAAHAGRIIEPACIQAGFQRLKTQAEALVVEGAGGFLIPLGEEYDSARLACELGLPVVLVVGMRLGCLNHALLSQEAIFARDLKLAGWVANRIDPAMSCFEENLATLQARLHAPLLGVVPHLPQARLAQPQPAAGWIQLPEGAMNL